MPKRGSRLCGSASSATTTAPAGGGRVAAAAGEHAREQSQEPEFLGQLFDSTVVRLVRTTATPVRPWRGRGIMRSALVLAFAIVIGVPAQPGAATSFPRPPELEHQIRFWRSVFTVYPQDQVVIHDTARPRQGLQRPRLPWIRRPGLDVDRDRAGSQGQHRRRAGAHPRAPPAAAGRGAARFADARRASHLRSVPQRSRPLQVPARRGRQAASRAARHPREVHQRLPDVTRSTSRRWSASSARKASRSRSRDSRSSSHASTSPPTRRWVRPASGSSCPPPGASTWRSATPSTSAATRSRPRVRRRATSRAPTSAWAAGRSRSRRTTTARSACRAPSTPPEAPTSSR